MRTNITLTLKVVSSFVDKYDDTKRYQPGDNLQTDSIARTNDLVKRGLCEIREVVTSEVNTEDGITIKGKEFSLEAVKIALTEIGAGVKGNAKTKGVTDALAKLTEEQTNALYEKLTAE